ncbi:MAG: alpha-2-macroglobulin [Planctomycetota bacterium]|nr:alpha-2-macroglobulin [Planctomycetota bacterium]
MMRAIAASVVCLSLLMGALAQTARAQDQDALRAKGDKQMKDGNWKDAYESFRALALNAETDALKVKDDLAKAFQCLGALGRSDEKDDLIEKAAALHAKNWRVLAGSAQLYAQAEHYGYIITGNFSRGHRRGGGKYVNSIERDRVRGMQLLDEARKAIKGETDKQERYNFYQQYAQYLLSNIGYNGAWQLQALTDLKELPDYEEGWRYGNAQRGAPVNPDGSPVYYKLPNSFEEAANDGERWRWALMQSAESMPENADGVRLQFAGFLRSQFGVQTMAYYGRFGGDGGEGDESGPYAVKDLGEDETIAKLASGIKRFKLPDEYNFIRIYREIAKNPAWASSANAALGQLFEDRQQYAKAAECWKLSGNLDRVKQITGNWGVFENSTTQPAGQAATLSFRFRNGNKAAFTAQPIDMAALLKDVKAYISGKPEQIDWQKIDISNIGHLLVERGELKYLTGKAASWSLDLKPRENHFDRRIEVETPCKDPGAYLVTATMADGNASRIVVWVADTVVVKKQLDKSVLYYLADAKTGAPVENAEIGLFGYRQQWRNNQKPETIVTEEKGVTDADGQFIQTPDNQQSYNWLVTATTKEGRFAFFGFTNVWGANYHDYAYNQTKIFTITDRPAYRPDQSVKFKFWASVAKYDHEGASPFAGNTFVVRITNPKGEKCYEKNFVGDEFGGVDGEWLLPKDATLGVYNIHLLRPGENYLGGDNFRVEEYKKPEFEVTVDAPSEPVMLGEKIAATINAKYLFGSPVTEAKVKYKITRTTHEAQWYPAGLWDWYYNPGYWWFSCDYPWYPGWHEWGCKRPAPWWWWGGRQTPPEIVSENEVAIGADGTIKVEIDTAVAKAMHGKNDHQYQIVAEVTDQSRRTIVGQGSVMVARKPFKVYAWVDRGHYAAGDAIEASFNAQTLDRKGVKGKGVLKLFRVVYGAEGKPVETEIQKWDVDTNEEGRARQQLKASEAGQFRLSYSVTDAKGHEIEGAYLFCVRGDKFDGSEFRFNSLELVADKREYKPGEKASLMVNTDRVGGTVLLFVRPSNGVCLPPKVVRMKGKSVFEEIEVLKKDMPNFFVEALTVADGRVHTEMREIIVPPESRVLNVEVTPSAQEYKPGEKAKVKIKLTEMNGEPFAGSAVVSIYDKAVEYISGGSNVGEIKSFFWKWRRNHYPRTESSLARYSAHIHKQNEPYMSNLGVFGALVASQEDERLAAKPGQGGGRGELRRAERELQSNSAVEKSAAADAAAPAPSMEGAKEATGGFGAPEAKDKKADRDSGESQAAPASVEPTVRKNFADSAFWASNLTVGLDGTAEVELTMPENLTGWKIKTWAMGKGTRVGEGEALVVTRKNLLLRLQAPRFFTQKDEVVLSANVHNYLKTKKSVTVVLEMEGGALEPFEQLARPANGIWSMSKTVEIEPQGEKRVDWLVRVKNPGEAVVRMKALTDEESDAMEMRFPAYIHGMLKTESFAGAIRPDKESGTVTFNVPAERLPEQSRLEVRYSPTLAGAMVDALPYMSDYPYGCTEQTLSRFLPTVVTQNVLQRMGLKLKDIRDKLTNLNAQEIGNDKERAAQWKRYGENPVFSEEKVADMVKSGIERLSNMQCRDGGWGWFSGYGESSYPHTTAYVVHGLQLARENDVQIPPNMLDRGIAWLRAYQAEQNRLIVNGATETKPYKKSADNLDAFVYMVLADAKDDNKQMREFLYRDRNNLAVYTKAMFGLALHKLNHAEERDMLAKNVDQFLVQDDENQTAYLKLPEGNAWWYWYGSEYEAHAYYLKLLSAIEPKGEKAARLVKYLINNRKNATYWNSTRDTAICIEAMADFLKASGEDKPEMTLEVIVDGQKKKEVAIGASNLFTFDNAFVLTGKELSEGKHTVEFVRKGKGPLYFNAYVTNFTLEDHIGKAGLEIKVQRKYFKLTREDKTVKAEGDRGQVVNQKAEKYKREELANLAELKSGDLVEIELEIDSKNDYEYILFEDLKAAGFEPVEVRSGYNGNDMGAYMELRDERVCFFVRWLARGKHSVSYRMRAEIPGTFSALPTRASAMYAPELKANSDELKLKIKD